MNIFEAKGEAMKNKPALSNEEYQEVFQEVYEWFQQKPLQYYYMLLSWEHRYFTLFEKADSLVFNNFIANLQDTINSIGELKAVEEDEGGGLLFWIDDTGYLLFPYDEGVVLYS